LRSTKLSLCLAVCECKYVKETLLQSPGTSTLKTLPAPTSLNESLSAS